jgi:predicted NAD-dependent protein-ADP-ribosyltransferase YbiA (DUF1768 family)
MRRRHKDRDRRHYQNPSPHGRESIHKLRALWETGRKGSILRQILLTKYELTDEARQHLCAVPESLLEKKSND